MTADGLGATTMIGPYRIERELARGGMGIVYLAYDTRLNRRVALKSLPDEFASDPGRLMRFEREAKLLASLNHPNISVIYDIVTCEGRQYLALELIEGKTLARRLAAGRLPTGEAIEICRQIASGMESAHECGIVHRDLKPGNVMITPENQVKIVDFGLGRESNGRSGAIDDSMMTSATIAPSPETQSGTILGTVPYLSPEQASGKPIDRRTDIWSFGCVLYECLTGRMAFGSISIESTIWRILSEAPDWSVIPADLGERHRELLRRSIELSFAAGQPAFHDPTALFGKREGSLSFSRWSIAADGDRFIATLRAGPSVPPALTLVTNWQEMVKRN